MEHEPIAGGGIRFKRSSVFEMSLVTVPANADCTIQLVKSLDNEFLRAASGNADKQDLLAGVSAKSLSPHQDTKPKMTKSLAESRAEFEAKRATNLDRMDELLTKSADAGVTLSTDESAEYDRLEGECKSLDQHIARLAAREGEAVALSLIHI